MPAMDGADFVRLVMDRMGATSAAELADRLGWKRGAERKVAYWLAGTSEPNFATAMELLEAAGMLEREAAPAPGHAGGGSKTAATRPARPDELDEVLAEVVAMLRALTVQVQEVSGAVSDLASRSAPRAGPRASSR